MDTTAIAQKLRIRLQNQPFGGIVRRSEMPELVSIAPNCGDPVQVDEFTITRRKIDQLDQFTISKPLPKPKRCPVCNGRLDSDGSCWWCANPE